MEAAREGHEEMVALLLAQGMRALVPLSGKQYNSIKQCTINQSRLVQVLTLMHRQKKPRRQL